MAENQQGNDKHCAEHWVGAHQLFLLDRFETKANHLPQASLTCPGRDSNDGFTRIESIACDYLHLNAREPP